MKSYIYYGPFIVLFVLLFLQDTQAQNQSARVLGTNGGTFTHKPRTASSSRNACIREIYRTIDGTCNNLNTNEAYGASDIELYREMPATYGAADRFNAMGGEDRISARAISNLLIDQEGSNPSGDGLSSFVFTWGQFLDHDITLTPEAHVEYEPISLPEDETDFQTEISFFRSEVRAGTGQTNFRQQTNLITSWIDASNVYGSDIDRANWLRTFNGGKLKVSAGNLLPYNTTNGELTGAVDLNAPSMAATPSTPEKIFVAGDVRANEQPGLTALHTLFVREHNRICDELVARGITNDEEIYQRARKRVGALMQRITYNEFLPALGVNLPQYQGYDSNIHPDIMNLFATAAYRLGHTMVTEELLLIDNSCNPVDDNLSLIDGFFNPAQIASYGIAPFLKGLSIQTQEEIDVQMIDGLRNFLFAIPGAPFPFGLDLAALNIQRGRDHGLPSYSQIYQHFSGQRVRGFRDITSDRSLRNALNAAYDNVNDIDAWVGLLAEDHAAGASLGPTLIAILGDQFQRLRDGDFYYYENDPAIDGALLGNTTLSSIISLNTTLSTLQANVFTAASCEDLVDNDTPPGGNGNDGPDGNNGDGPGGNGGGNGGGPGGNGGNNGGGPGGNGGNNGGGPGGNGGPGGGLLGTAPITANRISATTGSNLSVFPNPSNGLVTIQAAAETIQQITIIGMDGKEYLSKVLTDETTSFYEEELNLAVPSGIYFIKISTANELLQEKLVIVRK